MKFKMRILHFSPSGNAERIATDIARSQQANSDKIPPAYPVENEKLLFIGFELKGNTPPKAINEFIKDMSNSRAKNVACFAVGNGSLAAVDEIKTVLKTKDINIVGDTYQCPVSGLLKKSISDADVKAAVEWAGKIVDSL